MSAPGYVVQFVEGRISSGQFEKELYGDASLETLLGSETYLKLIEAHYDVEEEALGVKELLKDELTKRRLLPARSVGRIRFLDSPWPNGCRVAAFLWTEVFHQIEAELAKARFEGFKIGKKAAVTDALKCVSDPDR